MELKVNAIVTRAIPYRESNMIVTLVSVENGVITATAKGCLKPKAKLRFAAEPMNFGEYVLAGNNGRYIITECTQYESFNSLTADYEKYCAAALILETLCRLSPEPQPETFMRAIRSLSAMAYEDKQGADCVKDFLLGVLADNGYDLDFKRCASCKNTLDNGCAFSFSGGVVCGACADFESLNIDGRTRAYLAGEKDNVTVSVKSKANILLSEIVYNLLGVKVDAHFFTEQL